MSSAELKIAEIYESAQRLEELADSIPVRGPIDFKFTNFIKDAASEMKWNAVDAAKEQISRSAEHSVKAGTRHIL